MASKILISFSLCWKSEKLLLSLCFIHEWMIKVFCERPKRIFCLATYFYWYNLYFMLMILYFLGGFELAMLWMSRYYDVVQNCVLYGNAFLPMDAFMTSESVEIRLVTSVFDFAKSIAELRLTDCQFGLYAAVVLLQPGKVNGPRLLTRWCPALFLQWNRLQTSKWLPSVCVFTLSVTISLSRIVEVIHSFYDFSFSTAWKWRNRPWKGGF